MLVLRNPELTTNISAPDLRGIVQQRFEDICAGEEYEDDLHGYMIVVEPGDSAEELEKETCCPILRNLVGNVRFGDPGFSPCFEVLEEHAGFFELVFVPGNGDFGIDIFIPKIAGIDPELLAMCAEYAVPAP